MWKCKEWLNIQLTLGISAIFAREKKEFAVSFYLILVRIGIF